MGWYEKAMPTVKDVTASVKEAADALRSMRGVKGIHAFGSYAENHSNPKFNLKDVDLLVECSFESGDLLAIDSGPCSALNMPREDLEDEGFDPHCVAFTKQCLKMRKTGFDMWAVASDGVILHWGSMPESVEEWREIRRKAESEANRVTQLKRPQLCTASEAERTKWRATYEETMQSLVSDGPLGWYSSTAAPSSILEKAMRL